jgi:hypothetical protein
MSRVVRIRYQVERLLAAACGVAFVLTLLVPEWIELLTGFTPDGGDGAAEWALSLGLLVGAACFTGFARRARQVLRAAG